MKLESWKLIILIFVWLVSGFAGVSFLRQASRADSKKAARSWWRRYLQGVRLRFLYLMGILLLGWVLMSVFWLLMNYRSL